MVVGVDCLYWLTLTAAVLHCTATQFCQDYEEPPHLHRLFYIPSSYQMMVGLIVDLNIICVCEEYYTVE